MPTGLRHSAGAPREAGINPWMEGIHMVSGKGAGCLPVEALDWDSFGIGRGDAPAAGAYDSQVGGDHYRTMKIQPMQFALANSLDMATASVIKYIVRKKGDKAKRAEDLKKAIHCIELLAEHEGIAL